MVRQIADAELEVFAPGNDSDANPDTVISAVDIEAVDISSRIQNLLDSGQITLNNDGGRYTGAVTAGDRLRFKTQLDGETELTHRWTGMVGPVNYEQTGPTTRTLELTVDDFVFGVLDVRTVVNSFEQRAISASEDAILQRILKRNAPEIDRSQIQPVDTTVNVVWNSKSLLEAVQDLADRGDALVAMDDRSLIFRPLRDAGSDWTLQSADKGLHSVAENDDKLVNEVRVEGGEAVEVDDEQTTNDGNVTVTSSTRVQGQLRTRKSEVAQVEVWTRPTGSGDNLVVRLHPDEDGAPKAPNDSSSDIIRKTLESDFLADNDWTTFRLPDHTLPDRDPWLLVESEGEAGQDIGVNTSTSDPAYRAYYPYPLSTLLDDRASVAEYRRREDIVRKDNLSSRTETKDVAVAKIRHSATPETTITFPAESVRAHNLTPGDVIRVEEPADRFVGDAVVIDKRDKYDGVRLSTTIVAQDIDSI